MVNGPLKVDDGLSQMRVDAPLLIFNQDVIIEYKKIKISHKHVVNLTDWGLILPTAISNDNYSLLFLQNVQQLFVSQR